MFSVVDVRDVALAHVLCIETSAANGKRFILDGDGYAGDEKRGTPYHSLCVSQTGDRCLNVLTTIYDWAGNVMATNDVLAKCRALFPNYQFTDAPGPYTGLDPIPPGFRTTDNTLSSSPRPLWIAHFLRPVFTVCSRDARCLSDVQPCAQVKHVWV
jgi:hypothetical protein